MPKKPSDSEEYLNNETAPEPAETKGAGAGEPGLEEARQKAEEYLANWQRSQADFINYKRRNEEERQEFARYANAQLILGLLPAIDDLERALGSVPPDGDKQDWLEGVRLVERKFKTILEGQGVKPVKALGEPFDPNFHEALRQDKGPEGVVIEEFQKGYIMHDKLLRPALVVVGNGEEQQEATKEAE